MTLELAEHANAMAAQLGRRLQEIDGLDLLAPVQANAVFVQLPEPVIAAMHRRGWCVHTLIGSGGVRLSTIDRLQDGARLKSGRNICFHQNRSFNRPNIEKIDRQLTDHNGLLHSP